MNEEMIIPPCFQHISTPNRAFTSGLAHGQDLGEDRYAKLRESLEAMELIINRSATVNGG